MADEIITRKAKFGKVLSEEDRTIEVSLSSEYPVKRYDGQEVLVHTEDAIDFSRFPLPLLKSHDSWELNIGLVENPVIKNKKLRGVFRFGAREEALEIWKDVKIGIIRSVSIGYRISQKSDLDKGTYRATKWTPYEGSLVSIPADPKVGIGRGKDTFNFEKFETHIKQLPEDNRTEFLKNINDVLERYVTKNEDISPGSDEPPEENNDQPKLMNINGLERELNLKIKETEESEA